jgi:hypothetical protein
MPTSTIISDNGVVSGTTGLKTAGGDDGTLILQTTTAGGTATTALTISNTQVTTLANALPAGSGGTGITSVGTAGNVLTSNGTAWLSQAVSAGGDYIMNAYTSPATWTKPAGLKAVKVTVIGAGGNGGSGVYGGCAGIFAGGNGGGGGGAILYLDAPAVPGPITVTVGTAPSKTSSFGPLVSATGGTNGSNAPPSANAPQGPYAGGTGSGGTINITGQSGGDLGSSSAGIGGASALGLGAETPNARSPVPAATAINGYSGVLYGGGATGARPGNTGNPSTAGTGAAGIVIVEEFY